MVTPANLEQTFFDSPAKPLGYAFRVMHSVIPFSSHLLQDMVGTAEMRTVWAESNLIGQWMKVERAITESQAERYRAEPVPRTRFVAAEWEPTNYFIEEVRRA